MGYSLDITHSNNPSQFRHSNYPEKLLRGEDPLLSEGLRGTIETSVKWLFNAWKNH